ncbi:hypothetical protein D3C85_777630 [compost metagenome]
MRIEDLGIGDFFARRNHGQCFGGCAGVAKHHRRFNRVADRAGNQVQVVVGIDTQCQDTEQGQRNAHQTDGDQGDAQMAAAQFRIQGACLARLHDCTARRFDSCSTLG